MSATATPHAAEDRPRYDDLETGKLALFGFVSAVIVFALIVGIQALYGYYAAQESFRKEIAVTDIKANDVLHHQIAKLSQYGWVDRSQGVVAIPIERAMELVVAESQQAYPRVTEGPVKHDHSR